jgi:hypothetical protein
VPARDPLKENLVNHAPRTRRPAVALALPALATVGVLLLAACSSGGSGDVATAAPQGNGGANAQGPQNRQGGGGGGASGEIVAVDGTVLQLRSSDSQTSVTWTDSTTVTRTLAAALADVTVGSCVTTTSASTADAQSSSDATGPASTVRITAAADDGTCGSGMFGGGRGGFGGGGPQGGPEGGAQGDGPQGTRPTGRPDGAPTDLPSGAPGFVGGFGGFSSGKVTAVDGSTITIEQTRPQAPAQGGSTAAPDDQPTTSTVTVTVDGSTTYTKDAPSDTSAIAVGLCAVARGQADDSGKVTATALTLSDKGADGCTSGFVLRGNRPGDGSGGSSTDQTQGGTNA